VVFEDATALVRLAEDRCVDLKIIGNYENIIANKKAEPFQAKAPAVAQISGSATLGAGISTVTIRGGLRGHKPLRPHNLPYLSGAWWSSR